VADPVKPSNQIVIEGYAIPATFLIDPETGLPYLSFPVRVPALGSFPVSGEVAVSSIAAPVAIAGTVPVSIAGTVPVSIPGTVPVSAAAPLPVSGTVAVSGTVPVSIAAPVVIAGTVPVSGTLALSGAVAVSSVVAPVSIAGTVPVSLAAHVIADPGSTFPVSGTVAIAGTVPVSIAAHVIADPGSTFPVSLVAPAPVNAGAVPTLPISQIDPITGLITSAIRDYLFEVGIFNNTGAYVGHRRMAIFGNNPDVDTGTTPEDIWTGGGAYPWMPAATSLEVLSSSVADTAVGTGARTVRIDGLKADYTELSQTITLLGTLPVVIPVQLFRINSATVLSAGTGKTNAGDITFRDLGGGTTRAIVPALYGITRQSAFTVPLGYVMQIVGQVFSLNRLAAAAHATIANYIQTPTGVYRMPFEIGISDALPYLHDGLPGPVLPEKTDFVYRCNQVGANNTDITAGFLAVMRLNGLT
jgi:hypothetical protein